MALPAILNVDDSPDDITLLRLACRAVNASFQVVSVDNGEKAIAYLSGHQPYTDREMFPLPNLILLDLKMPGISGFEVLAWIRNQKQFETLPVVVFTASVHDKDRQRALELGASQFLVKTVSFQELQQLARTMDILLGSPGAIHLSAIQSLTVQGTSQVGSAPEAS